MAEEGSNEDPREFPKLGTQRDLTEHIVSRVDALYDSPRQRAEEVWTVIQLAAHELEMDLTTWDLMCFCIEFLGGKAVGDLSTEEEFVSLVKQLARWWNSVHYFHAPEIYGPPKKEKTDGET